MKNISWVVAVGVLAGVSAAPLAGQYSSGSYNWSGSAAGCGDRSRWSTGDWRGDRLRVIGLTADQRLICFEENKPDGAETLGFVSGLVTDTQLVGIDYRPAKSVLYGLGDGGGIYTIDPATAHATFVSRLNVALAGTSFGVDFNPAVDRLRVISDTGQNLRVNVDTGAAIVDASLAYTPGTPATGVTGAAYTNNDTDLNTATTLYDIDSRLDQVALQSPANAGTLSPIGKLTVDTATGLGFDIYSTIRNGTTVDVQGLAALKVGGQAQFYKIALFSGKATFRGAFTAQDQVIGIAIPLNQL
jgi:hypothetical protein